MNAPNPNAALKAIKSHLDAGRANVAMEILKVYGENYAAYALAKVAQDMEKKSNG